MIILLCQANKDPKITEKLYREYAESNVEFLDPYTAVEVPRRQSYECRGFTFTSNVWDAGFVLDVAKQVGFIGELVPYQVHPKRKDLKAFLEAYQGFIIVLEKKVSTQNI